MSVVTLREPATPVAPPPAAKPLSPARANLAAANERLAALNAEFAALVEPANRLAAIVGKADTAERRRKAAYDRDTTILAEWLAGGVGERPQPSDELLAAERDLVQLRRDREAAELITPRAQAVYMACHGRLTAASAEQQAALYGAAAEAALEFIDGTLRPRIREALQARVLLEGLLEVMAFGPAAAAGGAAAADRVRPVQIAVLRTAAPRDSDGGRAFLDRLGKEPGSELR